MKKLNNLQLVKGRIAKFSYVGNKQLVLLLDVYFLDPETNTQVLFRDHLWMDAEKIDKRQQGKCMLFYAKEYTYEDLINKITKTSLSIKYPQHIKYIKPSKRKNK